MKVAEYREARQKAGSLFNTATPNAHQVESFILAGRMGILPQKLAKMPAKEWFPQRRLLVAEMDPDRVYVDGLGPWKVWNCPCACSFICTDAAHHSECDHVTPICEVRELLFQDLETITPDTRVSMMTGEDVMDWEYSLYQTVEEVVLRSQTSPLFPWNGQEPQSPSGELPPDS